MPGATLSVPRSYPFVERLIGTTRREFLDHVLFWNARDLEEGLELGVRRDGRDAKMGTGLEVGGRLPNTSVEGTTTSGVSWGHPRGLTHATTSRHRHRGGSHGCSFAPPP